MTASLADPAVNVVHAYDPLLHAVLVACLPAPSTSTWSAACQTAPLGFTKWQSFGQAASDHAAAEADARVYGLEDRLVSYRGTCETAFPVGAGFAHVENISADGEAFVLFFVLLIAPLGKLNETVSIGVASGNGGSVCRRATTRWWRTFACPQRRRRA